MSWPVAVDDVKDYLNITKVDYDDEIATFIAAATPVVENIVGPVGSTNRTEWHDGGGSQIVLRAYPVISVTSITEYSSGVGQALTSQPLDPATTYDGNGYIADLDIGVITRTSSGTPYRFTAGQDNIKIVYEAGRATVPDNITKGTLELIRRAWETQRGDSTGRPVPGADTEPSVYDSMTFALDDERVLFWLNPDRKAPKLR